MRERTRRSWIDPRLRPRLGTSRTKPERALHRPLRTPSATSCRSCWSRLRTGSRVAVLQGRVNLGGALSGRDITAVNKTVSALLKLFVSGPRDGDSGRRAGSVGARRARIAPPGSRSSRSGCSRASSGTRTSATPWARTESKSSSPRPNCGATRQLTRIPCRRVRCGDRTGRPGDRAQPLPHRGRGRQRERRTDTERPGSTAFRESVRYAEQNLYARAKELVGDRDPRSHEFSPYSSAPWTTTGPGPLSDCRRCWRYAAGCWRRASRAG